MRPRSAPCRTASPSPVTHPVHGPRYRRLAPLIRRAANLDPSTRCWRCGLTLDKCKPHRNGKRARWTAGHLIDGQADHTLALADLAAECSPCNYEFGARYGNGQSAPVVPMQWR